MEGEEAWEIWSHVVTSGRQRVDTLASYSWTDSTKKGLRNPLSGSIPHEPTHEQDFPSLLMPLRD